MSTETAPQFRGSGRRFHLEESCSQNNNQRSIFIEYMAPGTSVPPHFHTLFSETFDLVSGSMTVFSSTQSHDKEPDLALLEKSGRKLEVGNPVTVEPRTYHQYVAGPEECALRVVVQPGNADFERLLMVMNGLGEDGGLEGLSADPAFLAVVMELSDAHLIGPMAGMLEGVRASKGEEVRELRERLMGKYDSEESLRKLLGKEE